MQYCPHTDLDARTNVIVAGTATDGTSLVISPYQREYSPVSSLADTSVGIAAHCQQERLIEQDQFISSDIFSVDALSAIFLLLDKDRSVSPDILETLSRMALYEHGSDRDMAHVLFVLNAWQQPATSPLNAEMFKLTRAELSNVLFEELLSRLPKIIEKVDYLERYWTGEEQKLELTENLLADGAIQLKELTDADTAVLNIDKKVFEAEGCLFQKAERWFEGIHPIAIHNATSTSRILLQSGRRRFFYYRADSLALANSEVVQPRKSLDQFAAMLTSAETSDLRWEFDSVGEPKANLRATTDEPGSLSDEAFEEHLLAFFQN